MIEEGEDAAHFLNAEFFGVRVCGSDVLGDIGVEPLNVALDCHRGARVGFRV